MISGNNGSFTIRKAGKNDLDAIKKLADQHKEELGFILRPALDKSISDKEIFVAESNSRLIAFVHYHHRKDRQTTLYHIVVDAVHRNTGVGLGLINALYGECRVIDKEMILLKCPENLEANNFYKKSGFGLYQVETGKKRRLNVWTLKVERSDYTKS
jgi:N-acetylglutamate synthase-like GNAT family acetyltransferase